MTPLTQGVKNPILRKKSLAVNEITDDVRTLVAEMHKVLEATENGIGLAAPQIGVNLRIFIILPERIFDRREDDTAWQPEDLPRVWINPELKDFSRDKKEEKEGCLSIPEKWVDFHRPKKVAITAIDLDGKKIKLRAKGLLARVFQHEVDHLNGTLIVDYAKKA